MTVSPLRSALTVLLLGMVATLAAIAVTVPAQAAAVPAQEGGARPADTASTSAPVVSDTSDPGYVHAVVATGAMLLITAGIAAGVRRSRRDPETASLGH